MISKNLLSRSLSSVYKELLLEEDKSKENEQLKTEIYTLAVNSDIYSESEIKQNKQNLEEIERISNHKEFVCHTDGAVVVYYGDEETKTGKSVRAGAAFIIETEDEVLFQNYFSIPSQYGDKDTNSHIAEYQAMISCLRTLSVYHPSPEFVSVKMYTDSEVMAKQMSLEYRVRDTQQKLLRDEALALIEGFKNVEFIHVNRSQNKEANKLAQKSIEEKEWVALKQADELIARLRG